MRTRICRADAIPAALCVLLAVLLFCGGFARDGGDVLVVSDLRTGEESVYSLAEDRTFTVTGNGCTLTVEIRDGHARVLRSDCPDQICVHGGEISRDGETLVCAPAGISLTVRRAADETERGEPDAVVG